MELAAREEIFGIDYGRVLVSWSKWRRSGNLLLFSVAVHVIVAVVVVVNHELSFMSLAETPSN